MRVGPPKHPAGEGLAAVFHGSLAVYFLVGIALFGLGIWFHSVSALRHLADYKAGKEP